MSISQETEHRLAIMQPYFFPYIGYFHLVQACAGFVFYDDVNFIKRGWINRNRLLNHGKEWLMTVPLEKASQSELILDVRIHPDLYDGWRAKTMETIRHAYRKAPNFDAIYDLVAGVLGKHHHHISDLAIDSVVSVCGYLGQALDYHRSSEASPESQGMDKSDRLIHITRQLGYESYVNPVGGKAMYDKDYFCERGVELSFLQSGKIAYHQFDNEFIPGLSIIDVLMFNDVGSVRGMLGAFDLV